MVRPEPGASCDLMGCPLVCGAVFHSCKHSEHRLLCPLERVPCLNSGFGCPFTLPRARLAEHLLVCPGSVVCCTMEWNRWPVSYADRKSYEHLSCGGGGSPGGINGGGNGNGSCGGGGEPDRPVEQLDMALALQDQRMLLESLRVTTTISHGGEEIPTRALIQDQPHPFHQHLHQQHQQQQPESQEPQQPHQAQQQQQPHHQQTASQRPELARGLVDMQEESYSELYKASVETSRSLAAALDILTGASNNKDMDLLMDGYAADKEPRNGAAPPRGGGGGALHHGEVLNGECRHRDGVKGGRNVVEMKDASTDSECELGAVGGVDLNHSNGLMSWEAQHHQHHNNGFGKSVEVIIDGRDSDAEERGELLQLPLVKPRRKKDKSQCNGFHHRPDSRGAAAHRRHHRHLHAKHKLPAGGHNGCSDLSQAELVLHHAAPVVMVEPAVPQQHASITVPYLSLPVTARSDQRPLLLPSHRLMLEEDEEEEFHMNGSQVGLLLYTF